MKIRIKFRKQGAMKFIGHLDIMRYFQKVMRRADVDIRYSGGFSPHQIMSFAAPLGVGLLSNGEYLDIEVNSTDGSDEMIRRMNAAMSEGMEVLSYRRLDDSAKSAMSLVAAADYVLAFRPGKAPEDIDAFFSALDAFYARSEIPVTKKTKRGEKEMDLKPLIYRLERVRAVPADADAGGNVSWDSGNAYWNVGNASRNAGSASWGGGKETAGELPTIISGAVTEPEDAVFLQVCTGSTDNIKPEFVMETFYAFMGWELAPFTFQAEREEVYADLGDKDSGKRILTPLEALGEDIEQADHYQV